MLHMVELLVGVHPTHTKGLTQDFIYFRFRYENLLKFVIFFYKFLIIIICYSYIVIAWFLYLHDFELKQLKKIFNISVQLSESTILHISGNKLAELDLEQNFFHSNIPQRSFLKSSAWHVYIYDNRNHLGNINLI